MVCAAAPATLHWQTNLEEAKRIAAANQPAGAGALLGSVVQSMRRFRQQSVLSASGTAVHRCAFIPIKINADDAPTTTKPYGIVQLPTDLILTPGANKSSVRMACPLAADAYMQQLLIASTRRHLRPWKPRASIASNVNAAVAPPQAAALNPAPVAQHSRRQPPAPPSATADNGPQNRTPPSSKRTPITATRNFSNAVPMHLRFAAGAAGWSLWKPLAAEQLCRGNASIIQRELGRSICR